ncbi:MAG: helicase RepA family protein [Verrucomicrobiaceae bacterium]|nr:helicase RepA family protein [Verrucomicrobiaceae bacterium]
MKYRSNGDRPPLPQRTRHYLENGASEGERNHQLFEAACQLRDAGMPAEQAHTMLITRALSDGLSDGEASQTINSAFAHPAREPLGGGHATSSDHRPSARTNNPQAADKPRPQPIPVPPPIEGGFTKVLETCFKPEEHVSIAPATEDEDGGIIPKRGVSLSVRDWLKKVQEKGGIERCFSTPLGLFIRVNPVNPGGTRNEDVTSFRHVLVEFDRDDKGQPIPKEDQYGAIVASGLPVSAVIDSANKSLHAWVRVEAPDAAEYRRRVDIVWDWFGGLFLDRQNKNPSRLSRCPDGFRTVDGEKRQQRLLAVNLGAAGWSEWEISNAPDGLPKIIPGSEFMATPKAEPPQLIAGVLHQGSKMILGGASKSRKSWSMIDMMLSVSTGKPWWGFPTKQGRVLYINFELPDFAFQHRLNAIAAAKGIADHSMFDLWNLRGYATDFSVLIPKILARIKESRYALIILDPIYKGLGKRDENKAGDIATLCNEIEQLAVQSGAAVVFGAHYSKGNQAGKDAIDRIGGSGVFARDPDVILTMTPHEQKDAYVVDLTLRALPQVDPFVVRWQGVRFEKDAAADASKVKQPGKAAKEAPQATYRRGGIAQKYGPLFENMPPLAHSKDPAQSEVVRHVIATMAGMGEACDLERARRTFDLLRNPRYRILQFQNDRWQGVKFGSNPNGQGGEL